MPKETYARRFLISGRVQGVGFRYFAERVALRLGIAGYTKNLADGRVEVYAIGREAPLEELRSELARGPVWSRVDRVEQSEADLLEEYAGNFIIEREN